jgi:peptide chain release factor 1
MRCTVNKEILFSVTLDDCDVQTFTVSGAGGQHRDRAQTGVRIVHRKSGATGVGTDTRYQIQNKKKAFGRMVKDPRFQFWLREKRREMETGKTAEERVAEQMEPSFLLVEGKVDGKWTKLED